MEIKKFKFLRSEGTSTEYYDSSLTVHIPNHVIMFSGTSSLYVPNIESNNEMERWYAERYYNESMQLSIEAAQRRTEQRQLELRQIEENAQRIFVNDTKIKYKLTPWTRFKTWWKYSLTNEGKISFCLFMGLLFVIFSMLIYMTWSYGTITEQISKMK